MDDDMDSDEVVGSAEDVIKSDEEDEWDTVTSPVPDEFKGEYREEAGEAVPHVFYDFFETPEKSVSALARLKDPKLIMMEQLKHVLFNLITDRPSNVIDYFEEYVRFVLTKDEDKLPEYINVFQHYINSNSLLEATTQWLKFKDEEEAEGEEAEGEGGPVLKKEYIFLNRMDQFEDGGLTLTRIELFCVTYALQNITDALKLGNVKFWGKIFGLYKNYYILEADVTKEMIAQDRENEKAKAEAKQVEGKFAGEGVEEEEEYQPVIKWHKIRKLAQYIKPPMPKSLFKPIRFAPKERLGSGTNKKVYFASNEPAEGYTRLPDVTPVQIVKARQIKRFFTGILDEEVLSDPPFPGNEGNFLRAQVARISAGTQLSPLGYYSFDLGEGGGFGEEDEDEGEEGGMKLPKPDFAVNPDFEPLPLQDLTDPSISFWVHHAPHILPQGRAIWVDPTIDPDKPKPEGEDMEKREKPIPEVGPPILTAASDDMSLEMIPPWSTRLTMQLAPSTGAAFIRSNLWLGAFTYALHNEANFENIYIGWGFKHNAASFTPVPYFIPQQEYEIGPEITEITDPDPEEEDYEEILYRQKIEEEKRKKKEEEEKEAGGTNENVDATAAAT